MTRPRLAVYAALAAMGGHRSADEVADALAEAGSALPRASVYNALQTLSDAGVVMPADIGPGRAVYEASTTWHHHFVCRVCGEVSDVACVVGAKPCLQPADADLDVDEAQVIFRGRCRRCSTA